MSSKGGGDGSGGGGEGSGVSIPDFAKKTIQSIREITGKPHSDEEIYALLKDCSMDPNEIAQKLLYLDTFHEVKQKRDRKKETTGAQGRGGQGSRVNYYTSSDEGGGGGSGGSGEWSRVSIPDYAKKMIQSIREITGKQCSDEEIYALLKECSMDPNETAQKLLYLDTFHEVKKKHDRKKETTGAQGRGRRGSRANYYTSSGEGGSSGSGGDGEGSGVSIPDYAKKTIQSIREITGKQHSDEEIFAVLKECSMDPIETAQKLLFLE